MGRFVGESSKGSNYLLEKYFHREVKISIDERNTNDRIVMNIVEKLSEKIQEKDTRFGRAIYVGSAFQRLKTSAPDEYDINIPVTEFRHRNTVLFLDTKQRFYNKVEDISKAYTYHKTAEAYYEKCSYSNECEKKFFIYMLGKKWFIMILLSLFYFVFFLKWPPWNFGALLFLILFICEVFQRPFSLLGKLASIISFFSRKNQLSLEELTDEMILYLLQKTWMAKTISCLILFIPLYSYDMWPFYGAILLVTNIILEYYTGWWAPLNILSRIVIFFAWSVSKLMLLWSWIFCLMSWISGCMGCMVCCLKFLCKKTKKTITSFEGVKNNALSLMEMGITECDYIEFCHNPLPSPSKGCGYFQLSRCEIGRGMWKDWTFHGDLVPALVKRSLRNLLQEAGNDLSVTMKFKLSFESMESSGTAVTCTLSHPQLTCEVSLDFSPVLLNIAPLPDDCRWNGKTFKWPKPGVVKNLKNMGVCLAPRNDFHWKISMSMLEAELMNNIRDDPYTNGCRRKSHRILKKLNEKYFCNSSKPVISSYVLKNILFWECAQFPLDSHWENSRLTERILSMTRKLLTGIETGFVANFVSKDINVLRVTGSKLLNLLMVQNNIKFFLMSPKSAMEKIM